MVTPLHIVFAYSDFKGNDTGATCATAGAKVPADLRGLC